MTYVTGQEVIDRHRILSDWNFGASSVASELVYYAEMEVNARLSNTFTTPFSEAYPTVKDLVIDLSYLKALYSRNLDEWVVRNEAFEARMERILNGEETIFTGSEGMVAAGGMPWSTTEDYHATMCMLDAEDPNTHISSLQLSEEAAERGPY